MLTLPTVARIREIRIYNRKHVSYRIDKVTVWIGSGLTGGDYAGATKVATITYDPGSDAQLYTYPDLDVTGSSVQVQGGDSYLTLVEVEVYIFEPGPGGKCDMLVY